MNSLREALFLEKVRAPDQTRARQRVKASAARRRILGREMQPHIYIYVSIYIYIYVYV